MASTVRRAVSGIIMWTTSRSKPFPAVELGSFRWYVGHILILFISHQFSFSLLFNSDSLQHLIYSHISISHISLLSHSTTIPHLTILEFIFDNKIEKTIVYNLKYDT
jgi:hypothetical protein